MHRHEIDRCGFLGTRAVVLATLTVRGDPSGRLDWLALASLPFEYSI
jgi:hypothetical protein